MNSHTTDHIYSSIRTLATLAVVLFVGTGCSVVQLEPTPNDPDYAPVPVTALEPPRLINGAIYQAPAPRAYTQVSFFEDRIARNVGDILTIRLAENTSATKETETEIVKETQLTTAEPTLFQRITNFGLETSVDSELEFTGEADSDQSNSLDGEITVTITEVLPNGVMRVRGEKWLTLNRGDEYIRISGLVRPEDIGPDNTIESNRVADARIAYSQTGALAHANTMGWLSKFFNSPLWPF